MTSECVENLARSLIEPLREFYEDPKNVQAFNEWLKHKEENNVKQRNGKSV
nr:MAG TPA_asm: hypothetical protein [Caudoviricetes sp.]